MQIPVTRAFPIFPAFPFDATSISPFIHIDAVNPDRYYGLQFPSNTFERPAIKLPQWFGLSLLAMGLSQLLGGTFPELSGAVIPLMFSMAEWPEIITWDEVMRSSRVSVPDELAMKREFEKLLKERGIDPQSIPPSFAQMARDYGISALSRRVPLEKLFKTLQQGELSVGDGINVKADGAKDYLYLSAIAEPLKPYDGFAVAVIPVDALDKYSWSHANVNWDFGKLTEVSAKRDYTFAFFLAQVAHLQLNINEIMFEKPVALTGVRFLVPTTEREGLLSELQKRGIRPIDGRPWDEVII